VSEPLTAYEDAAPLMQTGDIILMSGKFRFSGFFQRFQGSKWDHVGMIVRGEDVGISFEGAMFWESNDVAIQDLRTNGYHSGPQLVSLRDRMVCCQAFTDMQFAWRRLDAPRDATRFAAIRDIMPVNGRAKFPSTWRLFLYLLLGKYLKIRTGSSEIGCSENCSMTYQAAEWLSTEYVPNGFDPKDYSAAGSLPLINGATLGPEVRLAVPRPVG
jgi:hypothetical protein